MEPARAPVSFRRIPDADVILILQGQVFVAALWELGGELFADVGTGFAQLYQHGFTAGPYRWEHFPNPPINIRCNSLGRMTCQN